MKLANKVAIITGSCSGIGRGVAFAFAREGAAFVVNYPTDAQAADGAAVRDQIEAVGGRAVACRADVSSEAEVDALVDAGWLLSDKSTFSSTMRVSLSPRQYKRFVRPIGTACSACICAVRF